jgi:FdhD protein
MLDPSVSQRSIYKFTSTTSQSQNDHLATEEPLEIRLDFEGSHGERMQKSISITMRTPNQSLQNDSELAVGFLFTEGVIHSSQDVTKVAYCGPALAHLGHSNVIKVTLAPTSDLSQPLQLKSLERNFYTTSSCGVCGKASIDALLTQNKFTESTHRDDGPVTSASIISSLPDKLRKAQSVFENTGGLHASALFTAAGELISLREDVGRHNALDKLIGDAFFSQRLPLQDSILMLSGRISFELVQKAAMAGIRVIAAVGAPSSLAVELGAKLQMTLLGFVRGSTFNAYHGEWRIK